MQTHHAPVHDDAAPDAPRQAFDALGNPVEVTFPPDLHDTYHLRLKALLLTVWVVFSFGICYFARDIQELVPDWPVAYWMAAQGAVLMFLLIIVVYCVAMDYFERQQARDEARKAAEAHDASSAASDLHA
ncbi:DUF4212 domain-containing protein [Comamonas testosteroni]|uniref:DUF4212 domain-containing protein n=1 Tax=Comamonas testosteroni TaxID=285 RepID=UPI00265FDF08|nr:DUF4212 domain-containing protein [Comamonas testosteroni]WKL17047.1 DUF4212 domain-containing protein [Comamonas testosteroni]